jgi:AraC family transcriptional regulator
MTRRWGHGAFHAALPGMETHVLMAYYGAAQESSWRQGARRMSARTRPGSVTIIPEGQDGRWDVEGPIEVSYVYLSNERLQSAADVLAKGRHIELVGRICFEDPSTSRMLELLSTEAAQGDTASSLFVEQAIDLLCTQLVRAHHVSAALTQPVQRKGLADWQVRRVTDYMTEYLHTEVRLDELASLLSMSRFHFCTAFRLATGQTPHEWLTALRITQARRLLATSDVPVTSIALAVGYQTPSAFASSFRRLVGMTPSEFRRRQ